MIDEILQNEDKLTMDPQVGASMIVHYKENSEWYTQLFGYDAFDQLLLTSYIIGVPLEPDDLAFRSVIQRLDAYELKERIDDLVERVGIDKRRALNILYYITPEKITEERKAKAVELIFEPDGKHATH